MVKLDSDNLILSEVLEESFRQLDDAAINRKSPLHTPIVATMREKGPNQRIMVLREFDLKNRVLRFHTDFRSPKVNELTKKNKISILGYDPETRIQLKLYGTAEIYNEGDKVTEAWIQTDTMGRRCYLCEPGSGAIIDKAVSGLDHDLQNRRPTIEETEAGRKNFAIMLVIFNQLDWMLLSAQGNRAASFQYDHDGWSGNWLIP